MGRNDELLATVSKAVEVIVSKPEGQVTPEELQARTTALEKIDGMVDKQGARSETQLAAIIDAVKFGLVLLFAFGLIAFLLNYCPKEKRFDVIEKILTFALGVLGGLGVAKIKKE